MSNSTPEAAFPAPLSFEAADTLMQHANSYTRLGLLFDLWHGLRINTGVEWLRLLGEWWELCDNIADHVDELIEESPLGDVIADPVGMRHHLMTDEETTALAALPDEVTIWRGCYAANKWGLSWSIERDTAARFPTLHRYRQEGQPLLVRAVVQRDQILAFKNGRGEAEVIAWRPKHIATSHLPVAVG